MNKLPTKHPELRLVFDPATALLDLGGEHVPLGSHEPIAQRAEGDREVAAAGMGKLVDESVRAKSPA
jgi:hypothetical protein